MTTARLAASTLGLFLLLVFGYACARAPAPELPALPDARWRSA